MRLALNLDNLQFLEPDDITSTITSGNGRRGDVVPVEIQFVKSGRVVSLDSPTIGVYVTDESDFTSLLASTTSFTAIGTGIETIYEGTLDLSVAAVNALFASGATKEASAILEVQVEEGSNKQSSIPMEFTIHNSYTP